MNSENRITELMHTYFSGNITSEDSLFLEETIKKSPELQKQFAGLSELYGQLQADFIERTIDTETEWQKFSQKLELKTDEKETELAEKKYYPRFIFNNKWISVAALLTVVAVASFILFFVPSTSSGILVLKATDSIQSVKLADGSHVVLNKGSILIVPKKFSGKNRNAILYGNAYFEVTHKDDFPFIVSSDNVSVKVLGTKFFVNTNSGKEKMEVALTEGRVEVFNKASIDKMVVLQPGEKVTFPQTGDPEKKIKIEDKNFMAWQTGILMFNDEPLSNVVSEINTAFHSKIELENNEIGHCRISATFQHQPLDAIIKVVAETLNLTVEKKNSTIILSGKPCTDK